MTATPAQRQILHEFVEARANHMLLSIEFHSLFDYLHYLRAIATIMSNLHEKTVMYLAAAVSDFYIPWKQMVSSLFSPALCSKCPIHSCDDSGAV